MRKILCFFLACVPLLCNAQKISSQYPAVVVDIDLKNGIVKDEVTVPYGTRLLFKAEVPDSVGSDPLNILYTFYSEGPCPQISNFTVPDHFTFIGGWMRPQQTIGGKYTTAAFFSPLTSDRFFLANRSYCLLVRRYRDTMQADPLQQRISLRTESQFSDYVKLDFGIGYSPLPRAVFGTLAAHFYFTPVNDYINFSEAFTFRRQVLMRTSLFAGIAPVLLSSDTRQPIKTSTPVGNLIFGIGLRAPFYYPGKERDVNFMGATSRAKVKSNRTVVNQSLRINLGWLVFKQADASPVISKDYTKLAPYVSVTYDASVISFLAPIALLLGAK